MKLRSTLARLRDPAFLVRFVWFGGVAFITTAGGWFILQVLTLLGWYVDIANLVQAIWSIITSFYLNNRYTWADKTFLPLWVKVRLFALSRVVTITANAVVFFVFRQLIAPIVVPPLVSFIGVYDQSDLTQWYYLFAYLSTTAIIMVLSWELMHHSVFGRKALRKLRKSAPFLYAFVMGDTFHSRH